MRQSGLALLALALQISAAGLGESRAQEAVTGGGSGSSGSSLSSGGPASGSWSVGSVSIMPGLGGGASQGYSLGLPGTSGAAGSIGFALTPGGVGIPGAKERILGEMVTKRMHGIRTGASEADFGLYDYVLWAPSEEGPGWLDNPLPIRPPLALPRKELPGFTDDPAPEPPPEPDDLGNTEMGTGPETGGAAIVNLGALAMIGSSGAEAIPQIFPRLESAEFRDYAAICEAAVRPVLAERRNNFRACKNGAEATEIIACREAARAYDQACLMRPRVLGEARQSGPDVHPGQVEAANGGVEVLSEDEERQLAGIVGLLHFVADSTDAPRLRVLCSAVAIAPNLLMTARHCIFADGALAETDAELFENAPIPAARLAFRTLAAPRTAIAIAEVLHPNNLRLVNVLLSKHATQVVDDWVILRTATPVPDVGQVELAKPVEFDDLVLVGYQFVARLGSVSEGDYPGDRQVIESGAWIESFRYDPAPNCAVARKPSLGCFLHACQSEVGSSGAPLFRIEGGRLVLVGIQSGYVEIGDTYTCRNAALHRDTPNVAVAISDPIFAQTAELLRQ